MDAPDPTEQGKAEQDALEVARERARDSMFLSAVVHFDGDKKPLTVRVRNLSPGGIMIDVPASREAHLGVTVTLKNIGEVRGSVIWSTAKRMGIALESEIDPALARNKPDAREVPGYNRPFVGSRRPGLAIR